LIKPTSVLQDSKRLARLIWGPGILRKPRLMSKLMKDAIDFYQMLFPSPDGGETVVDFASPRILKAMFRIFNECLRNKAINPEFAFYARAEMGLYNLLHLLKAKVDTGKILTTTD
jgi:hypothetical protein